MFIFHQKKWATKHHRCRDTFTCKLERMADTNEWSVFLMAALATFSCCVASLNIPSLSQSSPWKATETENCFDAHLRTWYHHGNAWTKKQKDQKAAIKQQHHTSVYSPFRDFQTLSIALSNTSAHFHFFLMKFLPCPHFLPERGINSGLSVRRCVEWQSHELFDSPGDWPFHWLWQHTCCWGDREEEEEKKTEREKWELVREAWKKINLSSRIRSI